MRGRGVWLTGLVALLLAASARAEELPPGVEELRARVATILAREGAPGCGIALIADGRVIWAGGVGLADRASGRPVTADTLFRVGSITKSFIGLAMVRLAEQGRIDLGARVAALAPELAIHNRWETDHPITVAHLLEHTAGFDDMHPNEMVAPLAAESMPLAEVLARNPASRTSRWPPGAWFSYANPGYTVAGYLIEKVTGRSYEEVLEQELLRPLGMRHAALRLTDAARARLATGHDGAGAPVPYVPIYHRPAGNLMASPRELAALVQLALGRGRLGDVAIVSPAGFARIERTETARITSGAAGYGLGNYGEVDQRAPLRGHDGGIDGFLSSYAYQPEAGVGYVMLLNSFHGRAFGEIRELLVEYLLAGRRVPAPPPRAPGADLLRWAGVYHSAAPRHTLFAFLERMAPSIEVSFADGRLHARAFPGGRRRVELVPLGDDRFRAPWASGSHIAFREIDGRRVLVDMGHGFAEEPRWRTLAYYWGPRAAVWILATGLLLPLGVLRRRALRSGLSWPLVASLSFFAMPSLLEAAFLRRVAGEFNVYTAGLWLLGWTFAAAAIACAVQAASGLSRPQPLETRVYRMVFACAAGGMAAFLYAHGVLGIQLWRY